MRKSTLHIACTFVVFFLLRNLSAQTGPASPVPAGSPHAGGGHGRHGSQGATQGPPVVVKATVDKQQILIGQPIQLMLEATVPGNAPLTWPPLDSIPHFEWVEKGKTDSVVRPDGHYYRQYLTITSFDSGAYSIPPLPFVSGATKFFTDSVRIEVGYTKFDPSKDYHDIKDIIDMPNPYAKWIPWFVGGVTLLALALVIWLVRKKKLLQRLMPGVIAPRLSPYEEALRQLEELEQQGFAENGSVKIFYTRLNDILRVFIHRRLGISSLAETSEELIGEIRGLPLTPAQFDELAETLRMSDFVKFAKYQPGLSDNERSYRVIRASVERMNAIGNEREEAAAADGKSNGKNGGKSDG